MWDNIKKVESSEGNVSKYVYTNKTAVAESVLYRYPTYEARTVICCSTQSGCPVGCRFCGAGDYFVRSLSSDEIVSQVDYSIQQTGVDPNDMGRLQVMFMSMGEPLLNSKNLIQAIRVLNGKYPKAALLISTIGPRVNYEPIIQISKEIETVGLQFSLHKSTDEERNELIPFKSKLSIEEMAAIGTRWHEETGRKPFFNYCAGDDNSSNEDADRIYSKFDPYVWECTISVICERNEGLPAKNEHQQGLARDFSQKMLERGYNVRVFDPAGQDDIGGGCGQLWFVQKWMKDNPSLSKPSCGNGLPTIHTPGQVAGVP
jgi:23S rRNA (adenine2503-C2)-methyltransferase